MADLSIAPWIKVIPDLHTTPCEDIVLLGKNFKTRDFRSDNPADSVMTGAFVTFGTQTTPRQIIPGAKKCGGSILSFDPDNCGKHDCHVCLGFRNLLGIGWSKSAQMFATENGYDVRGSRPVKDEYDVSLRIYKGMWYGIPDYSANREPLTEAKFDVPDSLQAEQFIEGKSIGKNLGFVIDHKASHLTPPMPAVVLGHHDFNSSPSFFGIAPDSWGDIVYCRMGRSCSTNQPTARYLTSAWI